LNLSGNKDPKFPMHPNACIVTLACETAMSENYHVLEHSGSIFRPGTDLILLLILLLFFFFLSFYLDVNRSVKQNSKVCVIHNASDKPFIWFSCCSHFCSKNMELLTSSYSSFRRHL